MAPDFDQEGEVQSAEALLAAQPASLPPLLAAASGVWAWIKHGGKRAPMRAALVRYWGRRQVLRLPVPLTGASALRAGQARVPELWTPAFLRALAREAEAGLDLLLALERAWFAARRAVASRRKSSHAGAVIDLLAATPVVSATTLAARLGIAVKNAIRLLDELIAADITVEVTHRSRRRLFGLKGLAPLREAVSPPYRPEPGRGPGRPRQMVIAEEAEAPLPPLSPLARREFEYRALEEAMADLDTALRHARLALQARPAENPPAPPRPALPEGGVAR